MNWVALGLSFLPKIIQAVQGVEAIFKGHGKDKQDAAVALIPILVGDVNDVANKELLSVPAVNNTMRAVIDAVVAFQNAVAAAKQIKK